MNMKLVQELDNWAQKVLSIAFLKLIFLTKKKKNNKKQTQFISKRNIHFLSQTTYARLSLMNKDRKT